VLLEAALGRHPLAGLPAHRIRRETAAEGIRVPDGLPPLAKSLLRGLLAHDPLLRWDRFSVRALLSETRESSRTLGGMADERGLARSPA
jgi:hypothetical protein